MFSAMRKDISDKGSYFFKAQGQIHISFEETDQLESEAC